MSSEFLTIEKEAVENLHFPAENVLEDKDEMNQLYQDLGRALTLGNIEHEKIKIYFEDNSGKKVVNTTIWGVTDKRIILKQGVVIPINRIYKIV